MSSIAPLTRVLPALLVLVAGSFNVARAESSEGKFYQAYYLQQAKGDWAAAADLYEEIAADRHAPKSLRAKAGAKLAACREELASRQLARLMPPDALVYIELNRPADQLEKLLNQLGLLSSAQRVIEEGQRRVAISPALIQEVLGVGGVAAAVTGFNPATQKPTGVLVLHPGNLKIIRGLIETALPAGASAVDAIGGFETYDVEGEALVTLTSRLVIVGTDRPGIQGVVNRLTGDEQESLAGNRALQDLSANSDTLLTFFVNAKPIMPLLTGVLAAQAGYGNDIDKVQALLDPASLDYVMGRVAIDDNGLTLDVGLRLDEGHHNLVYNFLRTPAINPETLACVPEGVAAVIVGALNDAESRYRGSSGDEAPIVTALDIGREIFANVTSFALFALPPGEDTSGGPIPDVALALTVNDAAKSKALWTQMLGIASLASGQGSMEGEEVEVAGLSAQRFLLPNRMGIYFAMSGSDVLISPSRYALTRTMQAKRRGRSIVNDKAFASSLERVGPGTTKAFFVHAGRAAAVAKKFIPPSELKEAAPVMALLTDTTASLVVEHSDQQFRISTMVSGIPDVGDLVAAQLTREVARGQRHTHVQRAIKSGDYDKAVKAIDAQLEDEPENLGSLRAKFEILAVKKKDRDAAMACGKRILTAAYDDADTLNTIAWRLLTEDRYDGKYDALALKCSARSNKLSELKNWMYVDTLALAKFKTGDAEEAIELEKKALQLCDGCSGTDEIEKALAMFTGGDEEETE